MGRLRKKWRRHIPHKIRWMVGQKQRNRDRREAFADAIVRPISYPSNIDIIFDPNYEQIAARRKAEIDAIWDARSEQRRLERVARILRNVNSR